MKLNYLIKASPFLFTLILILCLNISNQKEYTKLRLLIWNTPSLTLGSYLAISTTTGFIISYFMTSTLANLYKAPRKNTLNFREENNYEEETFNYTEPNCNQPYDNTLIERDIKDPSPTINANFRIIGNTERNNSIFINKNNNNVKYDESYEFEGRYNEQYDEIEKTNKVNTISSDWDDDSYSSW